MRKIWIPLALLFSIIFLSVGFAVIQSRTKQVSAEGKGEIFYYVSAGNLVAGADGTGENVDRSGTIGYPNKQQTDFMALYGLEFGDETGVGLYNSVTDKLYGEDTVTGKNWGLKEYSSWNDWRCGLTGSSDSQYLTYRQINESSGEGVMTYIFEVDDTETELSVQFGTLTPYGWGEKSYNFRLNGGKEEEITSTNVGEVHSYTASGVTAEDGKNYITLEFGTDDRNAYVSWIMIATTDYELPEPGFVNYSFPYYIKKGDTTIQAFHPDDGEDVTAELSETAQTVVDSADTFDNVSVAVTINEHEYTVNLIVLPQSTEYFVDVGTTHGDGQYGLPDAPYISEKGYGYLVKQGEAWGTQFDANSFEDSSVYGANKDSFVYRFDVPAGTYAVEVGTYGHWNMGRKMNVNVNGGDIVVLEAVANTATSLTYCNSILPRKNLKKYIPNRREGQNLSQFQATTTNAARLLWLFARFLCIYYSRPNLEAVRGYNIFYVVLHQ